MTAVAYVAPTKRGSMSRARVARVFLAANGICELCGVQVRGERYEIEHRVPLNLGGEDTDANCYPAHVKCHAFKTRADKADIAKRNRVVTAGYVGNAKPKSPWKRSLPTKAHPFGRTERRT